MGGLKNQIKALEVQRMREYTDMRNHIRMTGEHLKPYNLIKGAVKDFADDHHLSNEILRAGMVWGGGRLIKMILQEDVLNVRKSTPDTNSSIRNKPGENQPNHRSWVDDIVLLFLKFTIKAVKIYRSRKNVKTAF